MSKVLLLNATYEPLCVVSTNRAMVLVLQDKAEILHESSQEFRSARLAFLAPTVVRLKYFVNVPYKAKVPLNRRAVLTRDNYLCGYCGRSASTIDHVVPRSKGGQHTWLNVIACCRPCNHRKGNKLLDDLEWRLLTQPRLPNGSMWMVVNHNIHDDWHTYLGLDKVA